MRTIVCVAIATIAAAAAVMAGGSDVLVLDPTNFDESIGGDKPALVEFYAPWCGHCKNLAPEYDLLATTFKGKDVHIASVDADKHRDLGSRFGVTGFPTLKWFPAGNKEGEAYSGGRTAPDMVDYINKKIGTNARVKSAPTAVTVLDPTNFDRVVLDPKKDVLVEFYAPWCGHCKSLTPKYEKVAATFEGEEGVVIAKVDADAHKELGGRYGVKGFPTIKFFPKANKGGEEYPGGREAEDFVKFINEKAGTARTLGGGWTEQFGLVASLDAIVERFGDATDAAAKQAAIAELTVAVNALSGEEKESGKIYEFAAKKVLEKGADWASTEAARLKRMLDGSAVSAKKKGDFARRRNIVKTFDD